MRSEVLNDVCPLEIFLSLEKQRLQTFHSVALGSQEKNICQDPGLTAKAGVEKCLQMPSSQH